MFNLRNSFVPRLMLLIAVVALLAACGSASPGTSSTGASPGASPASSGSAAASEAASPPAAASAATGEPVTIRYLTPGQETEGLESVISTLSKSYTEQHPNVTYEHEVAPQTDLIQRVQLLAGSNNLPTMFAYESGAPLLPLIEAKKVLDVEKTFTELGIFDQLNPATVALLKSLVNDQGLYAIPVELNIEGFWYNKKLFADNGLQEPKTWDELLQVAEALHAKGIQPFSASGQQGWPLTRLINGYAIRKYGPDVMERVAQGELKLTDPGFIEAAKIVQDMGTKGYFGEGVATIDYDTAVDQFLQGTAAMLYMGSWELRTFNDPARNQIGAENVGLFNIPTVDGGAGTADAWSMNAGLTRSFSQAAYDANPQAVGDWIKGVFSQYGQQAADAGLVTGFTVANPPTNQPELTKMVVQQIAGAKTGVLWFEARFDPEATTLSQTNAALLATGDMTPEQFMTDLQQALDS
ncbi:MAG TPA: extracellular solute-binding protein [Herpetosiphonaceae bacterium]